MNARVPLVAALVAALLVAAAQAGGWPALTLPERAERTRDALAGRVTALDVEVRDGEPWTVATVVVERWLRREGRATSDGPSELRVAVWGGRAPGAAPLVVAGAPELRVGERVLLWLRDPDAGLAVPYVGIDQGLWRDVAGSWRADDGTTLGLGADGRPALDGATAPDELLLDALAATFADLDGGAR